MEDLIALTEGVWLDYEAGEFVEVSIDHGEVRLHSVGGPVVEELPAEDVHMEDFVKVDPRAVSTPRNYIEDFLDEVLEDGGASIDTRKRVSVEFAREHRK